MPPRAVMSVTASATHGGPTSTAGSSAVRSARSSRSSKWRISSSSQLVGDLDEAVEREDDAKGGEQHEGFLPREPAEREAEPVEARGEHRLGAGAASRRADRARALARRQDRDARVHGQGAHWFSSGRPAATAMPWGRSLRARPRSYAAAGRSAGPAVCEPRLASSWRRHDIVTHRAHPCVHPPTSKVGGDAQLRERVDSTSAASRSIASTIWAGAGTVKSRTKCRTPAAT